MYFDDGKRGVAVCPDCGGEWIKHDLFCRFCGSRKDQPIYEDPEIVCIDGAVLELRTHSCTKCGYSWQTRLVVDDERFCPRCGGEAPVQSEGNI